eukprot:5518395-Amphidinium_carterae.1
MACKVMHQETTKTSCSSSEVENKGEAAAVEAVLTCTVVVMPVGNTDAALGALQSNVGVQG